MQWNADHAPTWNALRVYDVFSPNPGARMAHGWATYHLGREICRSVDRDGACLLFGASLMWIQPAFGAELEPGPNCSTVSKAAGWQQAKHARSFRLT